MIQTMVNSINSWYDWHLFCQKVRESHTYKHSWFVYADSFNDSDIDKDGKAPNEVCLGKGLTKEEAIRLYQSNFYAVENCGKDYTNIFYVNLYEPLTNSNAHLYHRATGEDVKRALELQEIVQAIEVKLNK